MNFLRSGQAARMLGLTYHQLYALIRAGRLEPPPKDGNGDYIWRPCHIRAAQRALEESTVKR